ncbi:MAG: hypothetical protein LQ344_007071 [Seirophora lacunosa]|nr:MAG: hypothetical protein LQ344_007071 [Seirophora lacunosa]
MAAEDYVSAQEPQDAELPEGPPFPTPPQGYGPDTNIRPCALRGLFLLLENPDKENRKSVPPQPRPHDTQARFAIFDPRENRRRRPVCCSRLRQADLESGQDERDKRQDLSFGDEASGAIRRASTKRPEVGAPHQILLLQEMLGVERFRVGAESSIVEMELTGGNQHFGVLAQAFPAKGERTDERSGSWMTMR